ncbi:hypothetical protein JCM19237_6672 [Photobacterium aphoticum]|uniref:Uncharacterized protein n=1 Tax=Photobacterium aphoticum TaxID=754436 RepID=A0A090QNE7_9GAMM|nr:hypothetical protein JCM19237_6672 [Photobacterium aphoticum]
MLRQFHEITHPSNQFALKMKGNPMKNGETPQHITLFKR